MESEIMAGNSKIRLVVDNREKRPLPLPRVLKVLAGNAVPKTRPQWITLEVESTERRLEVADYVLEGNGGALYLGDGFGAAVVERKGSIRELYNNLYGGKPRINFERLLARMNERFRHPTLVYDAGMPGLLKPNTAFRLRGQVVEPAIVVDGLIRLCYAYGVGLQIVDGATKRKRELAGEYVVRLLYNGGFA